MDPLNGPGALDLSKPRGMVLRRAYLISMSAVDVLDGGLHDPKCSRHLRVIDVVQSIGWYLPLNDAQIDGLRKA